MQRGGVVVELDQGGKPASTLADKRTQALDALVGEIAGDAPGDDAVAHQAVAKAQIGGPQDAFTQDAAMGMHERKRRVVANRPDVAEVIGQPLELSHECAQPNGAPWRLDLQGGFDGASESDTVGDGAVARRTPGEARSAPDIRASHESFDTFVGIAQPLFEADHSLPGRRKPEMAGLDDAGMHGADGDFMQALPFARQKGIGRGLRRAFTCAERMADAPSTMVKPRPRIGRFAGLQTKQVTNGRFEMKGRGMDQRDRRKFTVRALHADNAHLARGLIVQRHVDIVLVSPQAEQSQVLRRELLDRVAPSFRSYDGTQPRTMMGNFASLPDQFGEHRGVRHVLPQPPGHVLKPVHQRWRQIKAGTKHEHQMRIEGYV